ncbi:hypothetical protein BGW39_001549 [Mortierella sp. 14UC]|nr:hypothetical protein BGW39_001549 [Mortierella sp. 14UC]
MTSTCASSEVTDSFEDLSSLSSDKDIESLVLATTYDDEDNCVDNNQSTKVAARNKDESKNVAENTDNKPKVDEAAKEIETEVDGSEEDDFVDIVMDDEEDEEDVLTEWWESSRSASPESQRDDQQDFPPSGPLLVESHQDHTSMSEVSLLKSTTSASPHENLDANKNNFKDDPTTAAAATAEPHTILASMIPKMRISKDIFAAVRKAAPTSSSRIITIPSATAPPSPALQRAMGTTSRIRSTRTQPTGSTVASFITSPNSGSSSISSSSPGNKYSPDPKKPVTFASYRRLMRTANATATPATPAKAIGAPVKTLPLAAGAPEKAQVPEQSQGQEWQEEEEEEDGKGVCRAIRRSTGKRCTRLGRHAGYCQTHRLMVPK